MRSVTIVMKDVDGIAALLAGISNPEKSLEASDDGQNFRAIVKLPDGGAPEHTVSFPAGDGEVFPRRFQADTRLLLCLSWAIGMDPASLGIKIGAPPTDYEIAELVLHPGARVNRFEEKAAFTPLPDLYQFATPPVAPADAVSKSDVVDLTSKLRRGRYARLDTSGRQLGRAPVRLFTLGNHQPSGHRGGYGP